MRRVIATALSRLVRRPHPIVDSPGRLLWTTAVLAAVAVFGGPTLRWLAGVVVLLLAVWLPLVWRWIRAMVDAVRAFRAEVAQR